MKHRSHLPPRLREARTKLHQTVDQDRFLKGSLVTLRNTCGKENCRCARGELHESLYLSRSVKGKQKRMLIPANLRSQARRMVRQYRRIRDLIDRVSSLEWEILEKEKRK